MDEAGRRFPRIAFVAIAAAAFASLLALGFGMTFFADEWAFIEGRSLGDPATWLPPHNEHWTTLPILLYRLIVETIGIGSYVPYLAVVAVLHVVVATLVYVLVERAAGPRLALAAGVIILWFGSGFENLFWGFQTGFIGSLAFGLAAMAVTDGPPTRRRAVLSAGLLLGALMCSTIGVIVAIAVGLEWVLDARWRRLIPALFVPAGILVAWLVVIGRSGVLARDPLTLEAAATVPSYVIDGLSSAVGSITGVPALGAIGPIVAILAIAYRSRQGVVPRRAIGIVIAIAVQYALIGLVRGRIEPGLAELSRYTYVSGVLVIVGLGDLLRGVTIPARGTRRLAAVSAVAAWLTLSVVYNGSLLVAGRELFLGRADMTRALVTVALDPSPPSGAQLDRSLVLVPSATSVRQLAQAYGDPRSDVLVPFAVRPIPPEVLREAQRRLVEGAQLP